MENILKDFKEYLQSILDAHAKINNGFINTNAEEKLKELKIFTEDYNTKSIDRAVLILSDRNLKVNKEILREELSNAIKEYSKKFLDAHFKTG